MAVIRTKRTPTYRRHKPTGRAVVEIDGQRFYLGQYGTPESRERYDRLIAEWLANGRTLPVAPENVTVVELCDRYLRHAETHYRDADGNLTSEYLNFRRVIKELRAIYGRARVSEFGPLQLKAVRARFIEGGCSRRTCNRYTDMVRRIFKWGTSEGLVAYEILGALQAVEALKRGRCEAHETQPVRPVPDAHVEAIRPHVPRQVWAMVQLQMLSGARPGELVGNATRRAVIELLKEGLSPEQCFKFLKHRAANANKDTKSAQFPVSFIRLSLP